MYLEIKEFVYKKIKKADKILSASFVIIL